MSGWVIPAVKAILPHVGSIVEAAKPVFSRKAAGDRPPAEEQIAELQGAITQNAEHISALAEQLGQTVRALEAQAEVTRDRLKRAYFACGAAGLLSVIAIGVAVYALTAA